MSLKHKKIFITGAAGFIGSHLVQGIMGARSLVLLDKNPLSFVPPDNAEFLQYDYAKVPYAQLTKDLKGCDALFHLAAEKHHGTRENPDSTIESNILGVEKLFNAAAESGIKNIVFTSSLYAYGKTGLPAMKETDICTPHTLYGSSKLVGEYYLQSIARQRNISYSILRLFFVYGPKQNPGQGYHSVILKNFTSILEGQPPAIYGDGGQILDYIYIDDVVAALAKSLDNPVNSVVNICSGAKISILDITKMMLEIAKQNLNPVYMPADETAGSVRVGNPDFAASKLNWQARTKIYEGLKQVYLWMKNTEKK